MVALPPGCSNAVALEAAPTLAIDAYSIDIMCRMGHGPVNLQEATSMVGQGPQRDDDCEGTHLISRDDRERKT
jgi:hypothetical protein